MWIGLLFDVAIDVATRESPRQPETNHSLLNILSCFISLLELHKFKTNINCPTHHLFSAQLSAACPLAFWIQGELIGYLVSAGPITSPWFNWRFSPRATSTPTYGKKEGSKIQYKNYIHSKMKCNIRGCNCSDSCKLYRTMYVYAIANVSGRDWRSNPQPSGQRMTCSTSQLTVMSFV